MNWHYDIKTYTLGNSLTMWNDKEQVYQVYPSDDDEFHEPHAALIVKAVNQHDFLIDFIREFEREGTVSGLKTLRAHARAILKQEE